MVKPLICSPFFLLVASATVSALAPPPPSQTTTAASCTPTTINAWDYYSYIITHTLTETATVTVTPGPGETITTAPTPTPTEVLVPRWLRCGGEGWGGPTQCEPPYVCVQENPRYWWCL